MIDEINSRGICTVCGYAGPGPAHNCVPHKEQITKSFMIKIFWSPPSEISEHGCYVCCIDSYLYTGNTVKDLFMQMGKEWEHDKNLVG